MKYNLADWLTGYTPEELKGANVDFWMDHIHPEDRNRIWKIYEMHMVGRYCSRSHCPKLHCPKLHCQRRKLDGKVIFLFCRTGEKSETATLLCCRAISKWGLT
jgi:hypothetical protein